ncbi:hypothetical protein BB560_006701 [Smittium megazygosporum]|uniref:Uncharacterized protein n=1 Tax=Smittium megazygosporum TaxID=133381 RepID=A0A2T9Y2A9_9FUNG|nr:hypothetical protein BB560_006701 [Smittium megazygosporum]
MSFIRPTLFKSHNLTRLSFAAKQTPAFKRFYFGPCRTTEKTFDKILIANRGEIACRVIRTAKKMGIKTVAIYSDADAESLHVRLADEAVRVGPPPTSQSYLNVPAILDAIKKTGAQAVHPGYGFLSENSHFVKQLEDNNVVFIGPGEYAMQAMGDKIQSKIIAKEAGVNVIPGFNGVVENVEHAKAIANEIGYPIMIKATAGGGGKGMRIARSEEEVMEGFRLSTEESKSSFGDSRLLVERFIDTPRHIEIQLIADKNGNYIYLPERECSIQRRNQKVIEEAPSTHIDAATRKAMGEQAVALAKNVGYSSAGTVEFLVDPHRNFFFLEMNTRLQVEHPITEYITGFDLVEEMIRSAAGLNLSTTNQADVNLKGWAIESRVYAEDPVNYLPSIGTLSKYIEPKDYKQEHDVRCDSGITEGSEISMYYDPMICKLSTFGQTRQAALEAMEHSLDTYMITGVNHNIPLLRSVISHPEFQAGRISTGFLGQFYPHGYHGYKFSQPYTEEPIMLSVVAAAVKKILAARSVSGASSSKALYDFASTNVVTSIPQSTEDGETYRVDTKINIKPSNSKSIEMAGENEFACEAQIISAGEETSAVGSKLKINWNISSPFINAEYVGKDGTLSTLVVQYLGQSALGVNLQYKGTKFNVNVLSPEAYGLSKFMKEQPKLDTSSLVLAPMPGTIASVNVKPGDEVSEGMEVAVIEAMKMQNVLRSPRSGIIKSVLVKQGDAVNGDDILVELEK